MEVCEALLQEKDLQQKTKKVTTKTDLNTMVFVLQYMLTRLSVSLANKPEYSCKLMGAKVIHLHVIATNLAQSCDRDARIKGRLHYTHTKPVSSVSGAGSVRPH